MPADIIICKRLGSEVKVVSKYAAEEPVADDARTITIRRLTSNISYAYLGVIIIFGGLVGVVCVKRVFLHLLGTTCVQQPRMRVAATN